jgi:hypothetical protein
MGKSVGLRLVSCSAIRWKMHAHRISTFFQVEREVEITVRIRGQAEEIVGFAGYTLSTWLGALLCLLVGMFVSAMKR